MRKKAIITGGERGIGRGIAVALAKEGYDIAFSYYPLEQNAIEAVKLTHSLLKESGADSFSFAVDLSQREGAKLFFDEALAELGTVDLLINNAGVNKPKPIYEITYENFDYLVNLDFRSYIMMMSFASKYMKENNIHGSIINVTSSRGEQAYPNAGLYCAMKAGLNRAIEAFALDVAPFGIRINNVAPGAVRIRSKEEMAKMDHGADTDYFWDERFLKGADNVTEDFWDVLGHKIPLGRSGVPEDIGNAVVFLASDKASYITGITLRIDGGLILPGMPEGSSATEHGWG